jgi:dihydroneopterin aldolase
MAAMNQPDRIHLRNHVISTEIGAFQSERGTQQRLRFTLTVDLRDSVPGVDDQVDKILSYDVLTEAIDTALAQQRYNLVETLAERIAAEVLLHPRASHIEVTVEKLDRGPGALGITICRKSARVAATGLDLPVKLLVWGAPVVLTREAWVIVPMASGLPVPHATNDRRIRLLALDQAAWALADQLGYEVAETRTELDHAIRFARPVIWAPTRLAMDDPEAGQTPESLGFWLAGKLSAQALAFGLPPAAPLPPAPRNFSIPLLRI